MSSSPPRERLEPGRETLEAWLAALSGFSFDHLEQVADAPAGGRMGAPAMETARRVSGPIPEAPLEGGVTAIIARLEDALTASLNTPGPGYLAYIPGGGIEAAAFADLVANLVNRYTGLTAAAPALCRLEADVLDWLVHEMGYPAEGYGLLTPGGSTANLSAFVTARVDKLGRDGDFRNAIAYTSTQAHHSVAKSLGIAGIPLANVRAIETDEGWRLSTPALEAAIAEDRDAGRRPFLVVSSAGTTNTGAVDPLPAINDICQREALWHHVDGAYGGAFVLCEEGRRRLQGLEGADSITFDPHKGMFLPYGTGCLLVRDRRKLHRAHHLGADYLQDFDEDEALAPSPTDYGPELSRDFRGLRLWLPLMLYGAAAFRDALAEKLALAERFHQGLLERIEGGAPYEIVAGPQLSTVAFRLRRRPDETLDSWNQRNSGWMRGINDRDRVYLSSTNLPVGTERAFTLRVCVVSFRTHAETIDACLADLDAAAETMH